MSLGISLRGATFVVLGADRKRTIFHESGASTVEFDNKIKTLYDGAAYILAGTERGRPLFNIALEEVKPEGILDSDRNMSDFGIRLKDRHFAQFGQPGFAQDLDSYDLLIAGLDSLGEPKLCTMSSPHFASTPKTRHHSVGANGQALYFLEKLYKETLSLKQMIFLCYYCVAQTIDDKVGGGVDIAVIEKDSPIRFLDKKELQHLEERASQIVQLLQNEFRRA